MAEKLSVDDLLTRQADVAGSTHRGALEQDPDDEDRVRVKPVRPDGRCVCGDAITVDKTEIASVTMTEERAVCCTGEARIVVEIEFVTPALADVYAQLSERAVRAVPPPMAPFAFPASARTDAGNWGTFDQFSPFPMQTPQQGAHGSAVQQGPSTATYLRCLLARTFCQQGCGGDPACSCMCDNVFNACLDPYHPPHPCPPWGSHARNW